MGFPPMMSSRRSLSEPKFPGIFGHFTTSCPGAARLAVSGRNRKSCDFSWNKAAPPGVAVKEGPCELSSFLYC